jgi:hypothetical protein
MLDSPTKLKHAGTVITILGTLTLPLHVSTGDLTGVGWSATIILGGLLVRSNAHVQQINQRLIENNQNAIKSNVELAKENQRLREERNRP